MRDRQFVVRLHRAERAFDEGRSRESLAEIQALLEAPQDAFVFLNANTPSGALAAVDLLLLKLSEESRSDYDRLHGDAARGLWQDLQAEGQRQALVALIRRYPAASFARETAVHELLTMLDCGQHRQAAELARWLRRDPYHWRRLPPAIRSVIELSLTDSPAAPAADSLPTSHVGIGRASAPPLTATVPTAPYPVPDWILPFDDSPLEPEDLNRSTLQPGQPPQVDSTDTRQPRGQLIAQAVDRWVAERLERRQPMACAGQPLIVNELLLVRAYSGVWAVDTRTGSLAWSYPTQSSLAEQAGRLEQQSAAAGPLDFAVEYAGNSVLGAMASDGRRVFILDHVDEDYGSPAAAADGALRSSGSGTPNRSTRAPNRLLALSLRPETTGAEADSATQGEVLWSRGVPVPDEAKSSRTAGQIIEPQFVGAPLCVEDRLYCLAERDGMIELSALLAATGEPLWTQGLALPEIPLDADPVRARTGCTPVYAEGVVACPTETGLLVGVNALTGRLQWTIDHRDEPQRRAAHWTQPGYRSFDCPELAGRTLARGPVLYHLPNRSRFVHAVDIVKGQGLWQADRADSRALVAATDWLLLLLGDRECRALSAADGRELWRTTIPSPAGHGVIAGDRYLQPVSGGLVLSLDMTSGRIEGEQFTRVVLETTPPTGRQYATALGDSEAVETPGVSSASPCQSCQAPGAAPLAGNLTVHAGTILVTSPRGVAAFPQAGAMFLREATADGTSAPADPLLTAKLLLTLNQPVDATEQLEAVLAAETDGETRSAAEQMLREVLHEQLAHVADPRRVLQRISKISHVREDRLRYLLRCVDVSAECEDPDLLVSALDELAMTTGDTLVPCEGARSYAASAEACIADRLSWLRQHWPAERLARVEDYLDLRALEADQQAEPEALSRLVYLFRNWPRIEPHRHRLATRLIAANRYQEAEFALLGGLEDATAATSPESARLLGEVYLACGFRDEATRVVARFASQPEPLPAANASFVSLAAGVGGSSPVSESAAVSGELADTSPVMAAHYQSGTRRRPLCSVDIIEHRQSAESDDPQTQLPSLYDRVRRHFVPAEVSSLAVLDRGNLAGDRTRSQLMVIDRRRGALLSEFEVPSAYWQVPTIWPATARHFMPIGGEAAHGVSLLEGATRWTASPAAPAGPRDRFRVGPFGPTFCVLQTAHELRVVHPVSGDIRWQRFDLAPGVGLQSNEVIGIFGDDETLVVLDADQVGYTLYHTQSGRRLRRGRLSDSPVDVRKHRWAFGVRMVEVSSDGPVHKISLWDPPSDRILRDVLLHGRLITLLPGGTQLAYVTAAGRLQILDVPGDRLLLDHRLEPDQLRETESLGVFGDQHRFVVNLMTPPTSALDTASAVLLPSGNPQPGPAPGETLVAAVEELELPTIRVRGPLLAIDRRTGAVLWKRVVHDATLPIPTDEDPPALLLVSRPRGPDHRELSRLRVDVLDPATGLTRGLRDDLLRTRYVQLLSPAVSADERPALSLVGLDARVDIACRSEQTEPPELGAEGHSGDDAASPPPPALP
jgi:outer membrane protein assembly factor BamB